MALKAFLPPDTDHGYLFTFGGRAAAPKPGVRAAPKVVFQDADDNYTPLKQARHPPPHTATHMAQVARPLALSRLR